MSLSPLSPSNHSSSVAGILSLMPSHPSSIEIPESPSKGKALTLPSASKSKSLVQQLTKKDAVALTEKRKAELLEKVYPLSRDENNRVVLKLDAEVRKVTRVIYQFFRKTVDSTGAEKVIPLNGKTENSVASRISGYIADFNDKKDTRKRSPFFDDVREHPDQFFFRIRKFVAQDEDINEAETACIKEDDSVNNGYNENCGSGGGNKFVPDPSVIPSTPVEPITPVKIYPLYRKDKKSKIEIQTTPGVESKMNAIYFFKHVEKDLRYIGRTTSTIRDRFAKHKSSFNSQAASRPLPVAVQHSPNKFVCGVYGQFKEGEDPKPHEDNCIKKKRSMVPHGLNTAQPGGGGVAKRYGKRKSEEAVSPTKKSKPARLER